MKKSLLKLCIILSMTFSTSILLMTIYSQKPTAVLNKKVDTKVPESIIWKKEIEEVHQKILKLQAILAKTKTFIKNNIAKINQLKQEINALEKKLEYLKLIDKFIKEFGTKELKELKPFQGNGSDWIAKINHLKMEIQRIVTEKNLYKKEYFELIEFTIRNFFSFEYKTNEEEISIRDSGTKVLSLIINKINKLFPKATQKRVKINFWDEQNLKKQLGNWERTLLLSVKIDGKEISDDNHSDKQIFFKINIKTEQGEVLDELFKEKIYVFEQHQLTTKNNFYDYMFFIYALTGARKELANFRFFDLKMCKDNWEAALEKVIMQNNPEQIVGVRFSASVGPINRYERTIKLKNVKVVEQ